MTIGRKIYNFVILLMNIFSSVLWDMFGRIIIVIVILFVLGQNIPNPSLFFIITSQFFLLNWAMIPFYRACVEVDDEFNREEEDD